MKEHYKKVEQKPDLVKNTTTGAIINVSTSNYMARKAKKYKEAEQVREIKELKTDLAEMKELVTKLLESNK